MCFEGKDFSVGEFWDCIFGYALRTVHMFKWRFCAQKDAKCEEKGRKMKFVWKSKIALKLDFAWKIEFRSGMGSFFLNRNFNSKWKFHFKMKTLSEDALSFKSVIFHEKRMFSSKNYISIEGHRFFSENSSKSVQIGFQTKTISLLGRSSLQIITYLFKIGFNVVFQIKNIANLFPRIAPISITYDH